MNLQTLGSHTVDIDLLPEELLVLDVGCRWFDFTRGVLDYRPKARIWALDPSSDIRWEPDLPLKQVHLLRLALVGDDRFSSNFAEGRAGDGGGNLIVETERYGDYDIKQVLCMNIGAFMRTHSLDRFDCVKLDCEGSEFGILENLPGPVATQISVEFHDWTGPWKEHGCERAMTRLHTLGYRCVQHELSKQGEGVGHWDSLFVLDV